MRTFLFLILIASAFSVQGQFAPAAGKPGSTAIHKDSSVFQSWATRCNIQRGWMDITNKSAGVTTIGDSSAAIGKAGENGVVSLGDSGIAILSFAHPIINGPGPDFAIFENSFSDDFLELAFVEVSNNGQRFFRFPATSLTATETQTAGFGPTNPEKINNLAGKYRALYGTPFDLEDLKDSTGLYLYNIRYVKIIDVVGNIAYAYPSQDAYNHIVNDPWPTAFASGGFDLDAIGVINEGLSGVQNIQQTALHVYPSLLRKGNTFEVKLPQEKEYQYSILDINGKEILTGIIKGNAQLGSETLNAGINFIRVKTSNEIYFGKILVYE